MKQRTEGWYAARQGIPTASMFDVLMKVPRSKTAWKVNHIYFTDSAASYAFDIIAEEMTGERKQISTLATQWGIDHEPDAIMAYQDETMQRVHEAPFVHFTLPDGSRTGASPDGYTQGLVEIKCPYNSSVHLKTLYTKQMPEEHIAQVQGQLLCTGAEWCDFVSFDPRNKTKPIIIIRQYPDKEYQHRLIVALSAFNELLNQIRIKIQDDER